MNASVRLYDIVTHDSQVSWSTWSADRFRRCSRHAWLYEWGITGDQLTVDFVLRNRRLK